MFIFTEITRSLLFSDRQSSFYFSSLDTAIPAEPDIHQLFFRVAAQRLVSFLSPGRNIHRILFQGSEISAGTTVAKDVDVAKPRPPPST